MFRNRVGSARAPGSRGRVADVQKGCPGCVSTGRGPPPQASGDPRGAGPVPSGTWPCASQRALSLASAFGSVVGSVVGPRVFCAAEPPTFPPALRLPCSSVSSLLPPHPDFLRGSSPRCIAVGFGRGCASVTDGISSGPAVLTPDLCVTSAAERGSGCPRPLRE